jgi:hypothetical protein
LKEIKQRDNEPLRDFVSRFTKEATKVKDADPNMEFFFKGRVVPKHFC